MEFRREVDLFSRISTVSIENCDDKIVVHLRPLLEVASSYAPPNTSVSKMMGVFPKTEVVSVINLFPTSKLSKPSEHRLTVKEQPVEIVIEQPLDESSLGHLLELLGKHSPATLSRDQRGYLFDLLKDNPTVVNQLNIKKTGIRIVYRIPEQTFSALYRLPLLNEHFVGREKELTLLQLGQYQDKNIIQIAGPGGIGKSQLANYYARLQFSEKNYAWVIWIRGGEIHKISENISFQFAELGRALALQVDQLKEEALIQLIYERLAKKGRGLVIVDNAPNYKIVKPFLPENYGQREMDVLITTPNSLTFGPTIRKIILNVFSLEDAKRYIRSILKEKITESDIEILANTIDRYPLVLTSTLNTICDKYSDGKSEPCNIFSIAKVKNIESVMKVIIDFSLERIKVICKSEEAFERALRVLVAASYLAPEVAIPKALLGQWLPEDEGEIYIDEVVEALRALSLVEEDICPATYRIHKVVQDILRQGQASETSQENIVKWNEIIENYKGSLGTASTKCEAVHPALEAHLTVLAERLRVIEYESESVFHL